MSADYGDKYARLIRNIQGVAVPTSTKQIATITQVKTENGMAVSALANIGSGTNIPVSLAQGIGTITNVGDTWIAELDGGAFGSWRLVECLSTRFQRFADQTDVTLPTPQIPDTEHGGIYTESAQAGVGTPDQNPDPITSHASMYLYYWQTLPGSYSVFDQGIKAVAYHTREAQFEEWEYSNTVPLYPDRKVEGVTTTLLTTGGTAVGIAADLGYAGFLLQGQAAYWRINSEVMLGIYSGGTIGIVDYTGPGSAVRGQGFTYSTGGRAQPQGGALAEHAIGSTVELLMGQIALPSLRPGSNYEIQLAFVNQANRLGPWSSVQSFTAWTQDIKPSAPADLTVEHLSAVLNATWTRVTSDLDGNLRGDIRRYAVARHTAALAGTLTFAAVAALATIVAGTAYPISNTSAQVPSTQGFGNYIGIAAISDNGLLGEWSWEKDDLAPPYPDPATVAMYEVEDGIAFNVPDSSISFNAQTGGTVAFASHQDPGFREYLLLQSGSNNGTAAVIAGRSSNSSGLFPINGGVTGWYKLVASDSAGNYSNSAAPNNAGYATDWKFIFARYAEIGLPPNGNFQVPNETDTNAAGWNPAIGAANGGVTPTAFYESSGGLEGNRVYRFNANWGKPLVSSPYYPVILVGSASRIIPAHATSSGAIWIKHDFPVPNVDFLVSVSLVVYPTDYTGGGSGTELTGASGTIVNVPTDTWTRIPITGTDPRATSAPARRAEYKIYVTAVSTFGGLYPVTSIGQFNVWVDAVRIVFDV